MKPFEISEEVTIFQRCLDLSPKERELYLKSLFQEDPSRRKELSHVLEAYFESGTFMEVAPGLEEAHGENLTERPGDQIGRYRLAERIGEGSCGTVWKARQTKNIKRYVALKILKLGMDTKDFLARFEAERQMLAILSHPGSSWLSVVTLCGFV